MATDNQLAAVRKALRAKVRDATGDVTVAAADLGLVLDELGRLQQSNDRLRRQNRRVRLRLQRAGLDDGEADNTTPGDGEDGPP
ncbi:MAG: hypothetical protein WBO45_07665 [Planctomycetota bacterium]